jgi:predicted Zn-dependent protease
MAQRTDSNAVNLEDLNVAGNTLLQRRKTAEAVQILAALAEAMPQSPGALEGLGKARLASGDNPGALAAFEQALAIDPYRAHALEMARRLKART